MASTSFGQDDRFLCKKDTVLLLLLAMASTCAFHVRELSKVKPMYLALLVRWGVAMDFVGSLDNFALDCDADNFA